MNKSNYLENKIIDHIFRGVSFSAPSNLYAALFTSPEGDAESGTEVTGGSYARVQLPCALTTWLGTHGTTTGSSSGTGGQTSNVNDIEFATPTANWGQVTHVGLFDAVSGGNLLYWGELVTPKTVNNGDPAPTFPAGLLTVTEA